MRFVLDLLYITVVPFFFMFGVTFAAYLLLQWPF
jgi:hypothetical protein